MHTTDQFLTISEATDLLKVSKSSLRRWSDTEKLACFRIGERNERRFLLTDLLALIEGPVGVPSHLGNDRLQSDPPHNVGMHLPFHGCTMFKDTDEQWQQLSPFLAAHRSPTAKTIYLYHSDKQILVNRLMAEGFDKSFIENQGAFEMLSALDSYLLNKRFDVDRMLQFWKSIISRCQNSGIKRLLLTGEMERFTAELPGCDDLIRYEEKLDKFVQGYPWVTIVCQYFLPKFPATLIFDNLCIHPYVHVSDRLVDGLGYRNHL